MNIVFTRAVPELTQRALRVGTVYKMSHNGYTYLRILDGRMSLEGFVPEELSSSDWERPVYGILGRLEIFL